MAQAIWKGHISFGLVNVPVSLFSAEKREKEIHFHLIDSRDVARVRYQRVNAETGEEVPWDKIVKGYEYADGKYVLMSDKELESASGEKSRAIEIQEFVDADQIPPMYFDKPYVLAPNKQAEKGYVLLREAMAQSGKVGIARITLRTKQYLAALMAVDGALVVNLLRYAQELRSVGEFEIPTGKTSEYRISAQELQLAKQLISGMSADWKPEQFQDETQDKLMKLVEKKIEKGQTEIIGEPEEVGEEAAEDRTLNFIAALKRSVAKSSGKHVAKAKPRAASRAKKSKKRAG